MKVGELASGASKGEAVKTAEWVRKNVDKFKQDSVFQVKAEASASTQPQNLPDNDKPRQAMIAPPVDEATGLSNRSKEELDTLWHQVRKQFGDHSKPPSSELEQAFGLFLVGEETWDRQFEDVTNRAVEAVCARGALTGPSRSGSPAVAEGTKCESAAVADARCQSPAVAETSMAGGSALTPDPDQKKDLTEAVSRMIYHSVVEMDPPTKPISPQPQESPMLPQTTGPLSQHQPQQQALPQQPPQLAGLAPPPLKPPPPQSKPAPPQPPSPSPTPNQAPPQTQAPPSKPAPTQPPSPSPTPSSLNDAPIPPMLTRAINGSPPKATATPATEPAAPPLQVSDRPRINPLELQSLGNSPGDKFRSAVATSARQRGSSASEKSHASCYYDSVDSFEDFKEPWRTERFNLQKGCGWTRTYWSDWNDGWEEPAPDKCVGNFAIQLYNMGTRSDPNGKNDSAKKQAVRRSMDDHLKKSAAQINVCLECNLAVEELLRAPPACGANNPVQTASGGVRLADRASWEHHVCALDYNGNHKDTLMIAARKNSFSALEVLYSENMNEARGSNSRLLICKATSHRPIPRLGTEIIVFAVHGNNETMKKQWSEGYKNFWKQVQWAIETFGPHFFLGDFNMALLLVPRELSCRELPCHVLAYYPWRFPGSSSCSYSQTVGVDSCGIFYVKEDTVESRVNWPASHIQRLLSAGKSCGVVRSDWGVELHTYEQSERAPGQPWWKYRCSDKKSESEGDRHLETMLQGFLSSLMPQEAWQEAREDQNAPVDWTRFQQKPMPKEAVFVDGEFHGGAHMNLMVFTVNTKTNRSAEGEAKQKRKKRAKWCAKWEARRKSPSRPWSQSRPRWHESDWKDDSWRHQ